jgi:hypothetical protein
VGRFNNTADDVTQPLEIKHQNSGERITLDSSGFETRSVTSTDSVTVSDGEATNTLHYGSNQARASAGDNSTVIGFNAQASQDAAVMLGKTAGNGSSGFGPTFCGIRAGENSSGSRSVGVGLNSLQSSSGFAKTSIGVNAGKDSSGERMASVGLNAARSNNADRIVSIGANAGRGNTGDDNTFLGNNAGRVDGLSSPSSAGSNNIAIGSGALKDNQANGVIAIGSDAGASAQTDDQLIITDRNGNRRMVMDLTNGNLKIEGTLTENATL